LDIKKTIIDKDWNQTLQQAIPHQSGKIVAKVVEVTSWTKIAEPCTPGSVDIPCHQSSEYMS